MKYKIVLLAIVTITLLTMRSSTNQLEATSGIYSDSLTFTTADFVFEAKGIVNIYTSPPIKSPLPFNVLFPSWTVSGDETAVSIHIRTSKTGEQWGDWQSIAINHDWTLPKDDDLVGDIVLVPNSDETHSYLQYRLELTDGTSRINELVLTVIDSTSGPTSEEMMAQQAILDAQQPTRATDSYPKPSVISRNVWCLHADCNYDPSTLIYSPTTHLIVHHTAGGNSDPATTNWANVVRAVWNFHTYSRGWGDIGYNYLVDPNGVLYEGHLGGDDVKGVHASGANTGSMALSFMGNFSYLTPYDPMLNSAINLFAWKADQRGINVFDAASMPYLSWGLPTLSGHRDVYGGTNTACPGEALHELIPWLQTEVAAAIELVDPAIYFEETSGAFAMSNPAVSWYDSPKGCGRLRHGYYTYSVTDPNGSTNWGEWTLDVPANGRYQLDAYIPFCTTGADETGGAVYDIDHAGGHSTVTVSQQDEVGLWISLGEFDLLVDDGGLVRLTDLTTTDSALGVWFDSIRLVAVADVETTAVNSTPLNASWTTTQTVDFEWTLTNPANIVTTTLQAATDISFTQMITETIWQTAVSTHTIPFVQDYAAIHWRVQLDLTDDSQFTSDATHFGIDSTPPTSTITTLAQPDDTTYVLTLDGEDALVGLDMYSVDYRETGESAWTVLISDTTNSIITATLPIITQTYEFRSQAVDLLGNIEPPHGTPDIISTLPTETTAVNSTPLNASWTTTQTVDFEWALINPENIVTTTLQAATDISFTQMITETIWQTAVSTHTIPFVQDYAAIHWRVQLDLTDDSQFTSDATHFGIDSTPPTSTITALTQPDNETYVLTLDGEDALVGLDMYSVDYRETGESAWTVLISDTINSIITATLPIITQTYEFRSQAVDLLGNIEPPHSVPDVVSTLPIVATAVNSTPINASWTPTQTVDFEWALINPENIVTTTLQAATDISFTQMITETIWQTAVSTHTIPFVQDYAAIHWRVQLELVNGTQFTSTATHFGIDSTPPTSTITALHQFNSGDYFIHFEGADALVGVGTYTIEYREIGGTNWTTVISDTAGSTVRFSPPVITQTYEFRSQATDLLGNIEPLHTLPDAVSTDAILLANETFLPIIMRQ